MADSEETQPDTGTGTGAGAPDRGAVEHGGQTATWARVVIFGGVGLAVLLVGATLGLLLGRAEVLSERPPQPGAVDIGFSQDMSVHHHQAVTMGNWVREHSGDSHVRQIGFDIASAQQGQVGMMEGWLTLWEEPRQPPGEVMTWMQEPGHNHGQGGAAQGDAGEAPMPGMATSEELERMRSLSGTELDVYFLQLMHRHHLGGIEMAEYAVDNAQIPAVRSLAERMLDSQGSEITIMENMLAERGAEPLPFDQ